MFQGRRIVGEAWVPEAVTARRKRGSEKQCERASRREIIRAGRAETGQESLTASPIVGIDAEPGSQVLLAYERVAGGVGLYEVRKTALQVFLHFGSWIVGVCDETKVDDLAGFFVANENQWCRRVQSRCASSRSRWVSFLRSRTSSRRCGG